MISDIQLTAFHFVSSSFATHNLCAQCSFGMIVTTLRNHYSSRFSSNQQPKEINKRRIFHSERFVRYSSVCAASLQPTTTTTTTSTATMIICFPIVFVLVSELSIFLINKSITKASASLCSQPERHTKLERRNWHERNANANNSQLDAKQQRATAKRLAGRSILNSLLRARSNPILPSHHPAAQAHSHKPNMNMIDQFITQSILIALYANERDCGCRLFICRASHCIWRQCGSVLYACEMTSEQRQRRRWRRAKRKRERKQKKKKQE